ncbi:MAG: EamA family transporter [Betaproteobacteria bacterium]
MTDGQTAVALVLVSALMHATWNAIVKLSGDRLAVMAVMDTLCLCIALALTPLVPFPPPSVWPFLCASVAIAVGYKFLLLGAYRHGDFSQAYPLIRGSAPLMVVLFTVSLGLDQLPWTGYAGIFIISLGLFALLDWKNGNPALLPYALGAGAGLAAATLIDGTAVRGRSDPLTYIIWLEVFEHIALPLFALAFRRKQFTGVLRGQWRMAGLGALNRIGSYGLMVYAMSLAAIAPLAALRETSVLFGALFGYFVLKEPFGMKRLSATAMVLAGIAVLQLTRSVG